MNLSMKWLKDYVDIDVTTKEFADAMTMSGSKVEGWETEGEDIQKVVTGRIITIEKHPDADKLLICMVDVGQEEPIQIVTGAKNLTEGDVVPVALHGSTLPNGVKITKGKLRGVLSNGMLCSLAELKLTKNDFPYAIEDGIFVLQEECEMGQDIREVLHLDNTTVEFEITSNRPDCMSVTGLAREAAATFDVPLRVKEPVVKGSGGDIKEYLDVEVKNPALCSRYAAKVVRNVKIEPSPLWLRERLRASGVRPINNFVDITNYIMLELGHPMHAFDLKYVNGKKITVRNAKQDEKIVTLDDIERTLSDEMLVIADEKGPVAIAGVMGGEYSGIMDDTKEVVFEAACFDGPSVRTTAKKVGLRTESSARFEKGLDPANCWQAIMRACEMVELLGAGEVVDGILDVNNAPTEQRTVEFTPEWISKYIGVYIPREEQVQILEKLSFEVKGDTVTIPTFRVDVEHKADIAEEVARMYGYNKIPNTVIRGEAKGKLTDLQKFERKIHNILTAGGAYEVSTYSFVSPKFYDKIALPENDPLRTSLVISNPLGEDTSIMRTTTIPSMMEVLARNYANRNDSGSFYELGKAYLPVEGQQLPDEEERVTLGMYGKDCDFYTMKGLVEFLLHGLRVSSWEVQSCDSLPTFHPGRCAVIVSNGVECGYFGEVHPKVLENYDIGVKAYIGEFKMDALLQVYGKEAEYKPLPKFPASTRDISVVCDVDLEAAKIEKTIQSAVGNLLEEVKFFDIYMGDQIPQGKKSISYSIVMRSHERTLTDEEADEAMGKVFEGLEKIGAILRD